jgi:hypothetical protein
MGRSKNHATNSVSLFPFLAVLVCAMGALIFLLVITTERIRNNAIAHAATTFNAPSPADAFQAAEENRISVVATKLTPLPDLAVNAPSAVMPVFPPTPGIPTPDEPVGAEPVDADGELRKTIERLTAGRDERAHQIEKDDSLLLVEADRLRESETALSVAQQKLAQIAANRQNMQFNSSIFEKEHQSLEEQVALEKSRLRQVHRDVRHAVSKYSFIPFDGDTGTMRRPILVECTADGIEFLPERIQIELQDLEGFTQYYNPVLAGARALAHYWSALRDERLAEQPDSRPYVLLLVRPRGSMAFYAARKFLERLKQPYGYELLPQDWELDLPHADPAATEACRSAVEQALAEREKVVVAVKSGRSGKRQPIRFRRGAGGFVVEDVEPPASGLDGGSRANEPPRGEDRFHGAMPRENSNHFDTGHTPSSNAHPGGSQHTDGRGSTRHLESPLVHPSSRDAGSHFANTTGRRGRQLQQRGRTGSFSSFKRAGPADAPGTFASAQSGVANTAPFKGQGTIDSQTDLGTDRGNQRDAQGSPFAPDGEFGREENRASTSRHSQHAGQSRGTSGTSSSRFQDPYLNSNPLPYQESNSRKFGREGRIRRWGLSSRTASIGFERELTIHVDVERVYVGSERPIPVGRGETRRQVLEAVLTAIDKETQSWGRPPEKFYWVPLLRFIVSPGGNQHYERLNGQLSRWGLESSIEHTLETNEPRK